MPENITLDQFTSTQCYQLDESREWFQKNCPQISFNMRLHSYIFETRKGCFISIADYDEIRAYANKYNLEQAHEFIDIVTLHILIQTVEE